MTAPTFLDEKVKEIHDRLSELRPLVDEYQRLEAAERALAGVTSNGDANGTAKPQRRTPRTSRNATQRRRGRPRGSGTRAADALKIITAEPGITTPVLAERMGIKPNYLYRVLPTLADEGKVKKDGKGWTVA